MYQTLSADQHGHMGAFARRLDQAFEQRAGALAQRDHPLELAAVIAAHLAAEHIAAVVGPFGIARLGQRLEQARGIGLVDVESRGDLRCAHRPAALGHEIEHGQAALQALHYAQVSFLPSPTRSVAVLATRV